jgi:hypothetical protein
MNKYYCSDGSAVSQSVIDRRRSEAYRKKYEGEPYPLCEETGQRSEGSSHIVSQKRCKELHKTELIWNPSNFFPATHETNSRWESNDSTLKNYWEYMEIVKEFDPIGYQKRLNLTK